MTRLHPRAHVATTPTPTIIDALLGRDLTWVNSSALCAQSDPIIFHPDAGGPVNEAKSVCRRCPLQDPCLRYALERRVTGVWGATSEVDRHRLTGRRPAA